MTDMANESKIPALRQVRAGQVNILFHWLGRLVAWCIGWRVQGPVPEFPKYVVVFAPHTSNWDLVLALMVSFVLRVKGNFLAKHTVFWPPLSWLLAFLGGISVDRRSSRSRVDQAVDAFQRYPRLVLAVAPEGTRKYTDHWKSGFYHIAVRAQVPIVLLFLDYNRRVGGNGMTIHPSGDAEADLAKIRAFFETVTPRKPENRGEVRFRDSDVASPTPPPDSPPAT